LKSERHALEAVLKPPSIRTLSPQKPHTPSHAHPPSINTSLLSPSDLKILDSLQTSSINPTRITSRLNTLTTSIGPTIHAFTDNIHRVAQYRDAADQVSSAVLSICAGKLEERDREGRSRATGLTAGGAALSGDLTAVLRSLGRIER